jgi:hypothetical protein
MHIKKHGNWHTIYMRMSRRSKNGVLGRIFERLKKEQRGEKCMEIACLDNTYIKIYPDGTGELEDDSSPSEFSGKTEQPNRIWLL